MQIGTVRDIICTLFTDKQDERDSHFPALNEAPVSEVGELMRNCPGDKDNTEQAKRKTHFHDGLIVTAIIVSSEIKFYGDGK